FSQSRNLNQCSQNCLCDQTYSTSYSKNCQKCLDGFIYYGEFDQCVQEQTCESKDGSQVIYNGVCCTDFCLVCSWTDNIQKCQCGKGFFKKDNLCIKCNEACKECVGPTDQDCKSCNQFYFQIDKSSPKRCLKCPNKQYLKSSESNCSNCDYQCILCDTALEQYSMLIKETSLISKGGENGGEYCLICSCKQCLSEHIKFNSNQCTKSCENIGQNFQYDSVTNSCQCKLGHNYLIKNPIKKNFDCSKEISYEYYCDLNNNCFKCSQDCLKCSNSQTCLKCKEGSYLWQNRCYTDCLPELNIVPNLEKGICECPQGYEIKKLNDQSFVCILPLAIEKINVINSLMLTNNQNIPQDFNENMIIFTYNRQLTDEEYSSFHFLIDEETLKLGEDYEIHSTQLQNRDIVCTVVSFQNRKIKKFQVTLQGNRLNYTNLNIILVSPDYQAQQSSFQSIQALTSNIQSINQIFSSNDDNIESKTIQYLKKFQILCQISNFSQVLPLLFLIKDSLPDKIKFITLFGVSLIFNEIPQPSQITFEIQEIEELTYSQQLNNILKQLGIYSSLYSNFLMVHLVMAVAVSLLIYFLIFRIIMKGKRTIISCNSNCVCQGSQGFTSVCSFCTSGYIFFPSSLSCGLASVCNQGQNNFNGICCPSQCQACIFYISDENVCVQCNVACKQCIGPTDQDCTLCSRSYFELDVNTNKRCVKYFNNYLKSSSQNCQICNYQYIICSTVTQTYSMLQVDQTMQNNQNYCYVCSCLQCQSGYVKFNEKQCANDCDQVGYNYEYNIQTNSCQCQAGYNYQVKNPYKSNFDCTKEYGFGYYCNENNQCFQCSDNCRTCSDSQTCTKCNNGSYLWLNNCVKECFPSLNIVPNIEQGLCECPQGYFLQNLQYPIDNQFKICLIPLSITKINVYNYLMASNDETLPQDFYDNLIVFTFNRKLIQEEYVSFSFTIDNQILNIGQDYRIISEIQDNQNIKCIVQSNQNRKVQAFAIKIQGQVVNYKVSNLILVSQEYGKESSPFSSSKHLTYSFQSMNSFFSASQDNFYSIIIRLLKAFQILCYLSNFVQILPLIYLVRDHLPPKIKFASLFGSAIIFQQNPPPSEITFTTDQLFASQTQDQLVTTLSSFGLSENIYTCFLAQFLVINISILIVLYFFSFRISMKGNLKISSRSFIIAQATNSEELNKNRNLSSCNAHCVCGKGGAFSKCSYCESGYIFYPTNNDCKKPDICQNGSGLVIDISNGQMCCIDCCQQCNWQNADGSQNCTQCISGYELIGNRCYENCKSNFYRDQDKSQCTGTTDQDCTLCNQLYFQFDKISKRCQKCPNNQYLQSSNQFCSTCDYQCIPCNSIPFTFSTFQIDSNLITSQDYCLVCSCKQCQDGFIKFNEQQCIASCDLIGSNYVFDSSTNSCQCQPGYKYQIQNPFKNNFDCTQGLSQGYYCNDQNKCLKCNQNCIQCSDSQNCQKCNKGYYLWENNCNSSCFPNLSVVPNENSGKCECAQGYILQKLQNPIQNQLNICQLELALQQIHIYNKLMESNDQTLPTNFYDNLIVFKYNRELTNEEYQSFQFKIDDGILNLGSDYQIINTLQQKQNIQCTVVSSKNRKINKLQISVSKSIQDYQVLNTILVSKEYTEQSSDNLNSKQIAKSFESMSQTFTQDENSAGGKTISFLKQFQVLCYISNFVQVLPLIYLIRDKLPDKIKFSSLFGVSIIFNKTPPPSQITISSIDISTNDYSEELKNALQQFGISSNFYENFFQEVFACDPVSEFV
ncbi:hypothetical protein ABPG74_002667, partial [Tetrahymena malaccensis]